MSVVSFLQRRTRCRRCCACRTRRYHISLLAAAHHCISTAATIRSLCLSKHRHQHLSENHKRFLPRCVHVRTFIEARSVCWRVSCVPLPPLTTVSDDTSSCMRRSPPLLKVCAMPASPHCSPNNASRGTRKTRQSATTSPPRARGSLHPPRCAAPCDAGIIFCV